MKLAIVILLAIWLLSTPVSLLMILGSRNSYHTENWEAITGVVSTLMAILSFVGFVVCLTWHLL